MLNAEKNVCKYPTQVRHSEIIKKFATALFIYCGPLSYEFIHQNMHEALPSLRTVQRIIHAEYKTLDEGMFRFDDLSRHIVEYKATKVVSIGEDATRVITRVDYDPETDRCVGFVLPLDNKGLPLVDSFLATSFAAIENMFKSASVAKYAYVYMAQPLESGAPPFCLACLGTDNKFIAQHLLQRWQFIVSNCSDRGISVISFGGDGDSRVMKAMRVSTLLLVSPSDPLSGEFSVPSTDLVIDRSWKSWFCIRATTISFVQDVVHVGVKLKLRLLNQSVSLKMGPLEAGVHHLEQLRCKYGKEQHLLRERDLNCKDKQNYDAVLHIINAAPLLDDLPGAGATKCYVEIMESVVSSYLDKSLDIVCRIEKIWYAAFFLRYWRKWVLLHHLYTLKSNFITQNCYMCVELNAHALIVFVMTIRDRFQGNCSNFVPWMLGSQSCEQMFRTVRSMSSTFSTVLNFSVLGLLRRLHRLDIQLAIQANLSDTIKFPRLEKHSSKKGKKAHSKPSSLAEITDNVIAEAVQRGKEKAKSTLETLNMDKLLRTHNVWDSESTTGDLSAYLDIDDEDEDDFDYDDDNVAAASNSNESLKNSVIKEVCLETQCEIENDLNSAYKEGLVTTEAKAKLQKTKDILPVRKIQSDTIPMFTLMEHSSLNLGCLNSKAFTPYVEVKVKGSTILIRKTTAIWLFQETERVSADRLFRVRLKQPYSSMCSLDPKAVFVSTLNPAVTSVSTVSPNVPSENGLDMSSEKKNCDVIVIDDHDDPNTPDNMTLCEKSDKWVKIGSYSFTLAEKEMLLSNKWLIDLHMNAVQVLLKQQFPSVGGL